ncbi:hypothetical protein CEXT_523101 [Caerostris extrusa]|uniref:Uncharacterized protein n=1 Tax=Caerostris extrusa TaxID=172846 RepID=A0AAV4VKE6_CAEEX|nr:hypothetical protein CEXT_523101 [Caerostris extrusa]
MQSLHYTTRAWTKSLNLPHPSPYLASLLQEYQSQVSKIFSLDCNTFPVSPTSSGLQSQHHYRQFFLKLMVPHSKSIRRSSPSVSPAGIFQ